MAFYKMVMEKISGPEGAFLHGMDKKRGNVLIRPAEGLKSENPLQNRGRNVIIITYQDAEKLAEKESVV